MLELINAWDFRGSETLKFEELPIQIQRRLGNLSNFWQILTYEGNTSDLVGVYTHAFLVIQK